MATKTYVIGSTGPFLYDDSNSFPDGTAHGIETDGVLRTTNTPTVGDDVLRLDDLGAIGGVAPSDAEYLVLTLSSNLTSERVLTAGTNITFVDAGANGTLTISSTGGSGTGSEYWQDPIVDILSTPPI